MAQTSDRLNLKHISHATNEALRVIDARRKGEVVFLQTPWPKLNKNLTGGIEWNSLFTIAGISGSGKSSIADELESGLVDLNPQEPIVILSFNYEMVSSKRVTRKFSNKMHLTVKDLMSADKPLSDHQFNHAVGIAEKILKYPVYYVDSSGNVDQMYSTIKYFTETIGQGKSILIFLDHTILTKRRQGQAEREMLSELQSMFIDVKKHGAENGLYKSLIFQLSQLNRSIEDQDRLMTPEGHYPRRGDIFGGDSVYQASDYVLVTHRPELLYINAYGPSALPVEDAIYWHLLKARDGDPCIMRMKNMLHVNKVAEYDEGESNSAATARLLPPR